MGRLSARSFETKTGVVSFADDMLFSYGSAQGLVCRTFFQLLSVEGLKVAMISGHRTLVPQALHARVNRLESHKKPKGSRITIMSTAGSILCLTEFVISSHNCVYCRNSCMILCCDSLM